MCIEEDNLGPKISREITIGASRGF